MKYAHLLSAVCSTPWAITPDKLDEILSVLATRASGQMFAAEDIEARLGARSAGVSRQTARGVSVLPVRGTIAHRMGGMDESSGGISTERLSGMLAQAVADETVGTILLDIDSPGGTVTGVSEFAAQLFASRDRGKKLVALVNGLAASAAYWIASQAHEIVSIPSGQAGSIGVYTAHADLSRKLEKDGIDISLISAGKHKVDGMPFAPLSDEYRAELQGRVDEAYQQFTLDVARGRGVSVSEVRGGFGEGRVLSAKAAKAAGLIDRIATVEDTLARVSPPAAAALRAETWPAAAVARFGRF